MFDWIEYDNNSPGFLLTSNFFDIHLDGDSNDLLIEQEITDSLKSDVLQKSSCGASKEGWLWVAGIQGYSNDPGGALEDAICKLKCRYALECKVCYLRHF